MKKRILLGLGFMLILALFFTTLISAQPFDIDLEQGSQQIINWIEDLFRPFASILLGGEGQFLFERILFLILIIAVVYTILSRISLFEDRQGITWVVTFIVALLATKFLTETAIVQYVLLPYSVLGIALTGLIPLIIFFFFVQSFDSIVIRKLLWIFFVITFFGIWMSRLPEIGELAWIYFLVGIAALLFFLFDGSIRRALVKQQIAQLGYDTKNQLEIEIRRQLRDNDLDLRNGVITSSEYKRIKKRLNKQLKALRKN